VLSTRRNAVIGALARPATESATSGIVGAGNPIDEIPPHHVGNDPGNVAAPERKTGRIPFPARTNRSTPRRMETSQ
jgi:hypothetical protein